MTKLCSVCSTENRDEAQFCRACGTAFAPIQAAGSEDDALAAGVTCDECGFQNKPGIRYCANCGVSLMGTVIVPRSRAAAPSQPAPDPYAGLSPPPISYPSFAPVPPYPSQAAYEAAEAVGYAPQAHIDADALPADNDAAATHAYEQERAPDAATAMPATEPSKTRLPIVLAIVALLLVVGGAAAWWGMGAGGRATAPGPGAAPVIATPAPVAPPPAPTVAPVPVEPAVVVAPPAAPEATASAAVTAATPAPTPTLPPAAAAPLPQVGDPPDAEAEAKRLAADKLRRERAARDKADREAKAKLALEQRDREAAAARAEQEAQARRRAEEAQRARPVAAVPVPPPAPAPVQVRGVREICAGRGSIAEAICISRECASSQNASQAVCRQVRETEERRRNYQN